jgi:hypothetical protein
MPRNCSHRFHPPITVNQATIVAALLRAISRSLLVTGALVVAGCWTAPVATVQPHGEARLIQGSIAVTSVKDPVVVASVDRSAGSIALRTAGRGETSTYRVGPQVSTLNEIGVGDVVKATVTEDLAIYVLQDGHAPGLEGTVSADARVLTVDESYRLLTLQYHDGQRETLKVPLGTKLEQMQAGDAVVIRPVEVLVLRRKG